MTICGNCNGRGKMGLGRLCPHCIDGDTGERRATAYHEAAHVEVARALGATGMHARVYAKPRYFSGIDGHYSGRFNGSQADQAVIALAGSVGAALLAGDDCGGSDDLKDAKRLLRGTGVSVEAAKKRAARLILANKDAINATARRLHRRGRI